METEKSQDPASVEVSKGNNQSPTLGSGILKYRSRSQGKSGLIKDSGSKVFLMSISFSSLKVR